jgi:hypothetical protein
LIFQGARYAYTHTTSDPKYTHIILPIWYLISVTWKEHRSRDAELNWLRSDVGDFSSKKCTRHYCDAYTGVWRIQPLAAEESRAMRSVRCWHILQGSALIQASWKCFLINLLYADSWLIVHVYSFYRLFVVRRIEFRNTESLKFVRCSTDARWMDSNICTKNNLQWLQLELIRDAREFTYNDNKFYIKSSCHNTLLIEEFE